MAYMQQHSTDVTKTGKWTQCTASDSFPCGSIPPARRTTMYYWSSVGHDFDGNGTISGWELRMLPLSNVVTSTGNSIPVQSGVGAVVCYVKAKTLASDPTTCTDSGSASSTSVVTVVSVASLPNEGARNTVTQSIGSYSLLNNLPNAPPILASGSVDVTGGLQVVTNPNSGGTGVPVSVWSRKALAKTGTPNTCYYNEFLHNSSGGTNGTVYTDAASPNFPLCDNCTCAGADSLSFDSSGNKVDAGIDILQNSGNNSDYSKPLADVNGDGVPDYANYDVKPSEFPCDLFAQVFKVKAWEDDDSPKDNFCETKITTTYKNPNDGSLIPMGADEAFLYQYASTIVHPTTDPDLIETAAQKDSLNAYPSAGYSGLVWCQKNCDIGSNKVLGKAAKPVLLVIDDAAGVKIQGKVFGMVFIRSLAGGATLTPSTGYTMTSSEITSGGSGSLAMNSGAVVYGAVVIQGQITHANGTSSIVYNSDILTTLGGLPPFNPFVGVPGGWTDSVSY
jgi:hypothetical protein